MKKVTLDVSGGRARKLQMDVELSFKPFVEHLRKRAAEERTPKVAFYKAVLEQFEQSGVGESDIPLDKIHEYGGLLENMYACLSPPLAVEKQQAWGLGFPFHPIVFYGTDSLCDMLGKKDPKDDRMGKTPKDFHCERLRIIYSLILERLYNFHAPEKPGMTHAWTDQETGLLRYYRVHINANFIEVSAKGDLPDIDFCGLYGSLSEDTGAGYDVLEKSLPLGLFRFRGITVITVSDVTDKQAVENIKKVRLSRIPGNEEAIYKHVIQSLKTLVKNDRIEFDLFPFVRINNKPVFGYVRGGTGILYSVWGEKSLSQEEFQQQAERYIADPRVFFSPDILTGNKELSFLDAFRKAGVRSLAIRPVSYDQVLVGTLAMHTWKDERFDEKALSMLEPAIPAIAQLFQVYIDEFNLEIENIIKEKFTSVQPAVQWKFNEVAWHDLHRKKKNLPPETEGIQFKEVYPLYGAIDIRNSTQERNKAVIADLRTHLDLLSGTLAALQQQDPSSLMKELIFQCKKWQQVLKEGPLNTTMETDLNNFLEEEIDPYLDHLSRQEAETRETIGAYQQAVRSGKGDVYHDRNALEASMQQINQGINQYFESEKGSLQQAYPCYFEKFRTDGIEYDIYIGQSIAPERPFDHFHLKNLRLWQLSSMAAIARITCSLLPGMPKPLRTTQLIFVHDHTIDISFRTDERRFDVEGGYNIRYQMIKKRIDKVHIRDSKERLTQPDKIALIYFNERDVKDYRPFIRYLQETNVLQDDLEELDLEDLQGLSGLKALRVGVIQETETNGKK